MMWFILPQRNSTVLAYWIEIQVYFKVSFWGKSLIECNSVQYNPSFWNIFGSWYFLGFEKKSFEWKSFLTYKYIQSFVEYL